MFRFDEDKTVVFFDYETFNLCLSFLHNRPWQLGLLTMENGEKTQAENLYIGWETDLKISDDAARITRYNKKTHDEKALPQKEVFETMYEAFEKADWIIGHNIIGFDLHLFKEWCLVNKADWKKLLPKFIDSNCVAKGIALGLQPDPKDDFTHYQYRLYHHRARGIKTSLTALGKQLEIDVDYDNLHDALNDIELNRLVWDKLKFQIER